MKRSYFAALFVLCIAMPSWAQRDKLIKNRPDNIPNQYIVVLEDDILPEQVPEFAHQLVAEHGAQLRDVWSAGIKGFFAVMPEAKALAMSRNPHVKFVEENARMYLSSATKTNVNPVTCDPTTNPNCTAVSDNRLWHLDRADQNWPDPNNEYRYCTTGNGKTIYVVDSGVIAAHQELTGRVLTGFNATGDLTPEDTTDKMPANDPCRHSNAGLNIGAGFAPPPTGFFQYSWETSHYVQEWRGNGHGTAVASAAAGTRVGVAKNATIIPVKVIRCDQYSSRFRIPSRHYLQNETMFIGETNGSIRGIYRAMNEGNASSEDAITTDQVNTWPVGSDTYKPTKVDNQITWEWVPSAWYSTTGSIDMLVRGLNWIVSAANTQGPHSYAVVTLSTYRRRNDGNVSSIDTVIRSLLSSNLTVIASANNQNGDACDTVPGRLSRNNPTPSLQGNVITAGGTMIVNQPWSANLTEPPSTGDATAAAGGTKGTEPAYTSTKGVREARWICGRGDSDVCSNADATSTIALAAGYEDFTGGSNGGQCVTLFAPAKNLFVARNTAANDYRDARLDQGWASGTSWSAPIVAGFAARLLEANGNLTPDQMYNAMLANTTASLESSQDYPLDPKDVNGNTISGTPNKVLRLADVHIDTQPQNTPIASPGPTTFTVAAGGTTTLSYQWYQVNAGFDYSTYPHGIHPPDSSTAIGTNSNTLQVNPTQQTAYWVRVTNSCGSADSDIALATIAISPPTNVTATGSGATVTIIWSAVSGADGYKVQSKVSSLDWADAVTVTGGNVTSTTHTPSTTTGVVLYRVLAKSGSTYSGSSNNDVAWVGTFTDDPVGIPPSSYTTIKAEHITEMRKAVNALLDIGGQSPVYTTAETNPNNLRNLAVAAADFNTLMANLNTARGLPIVALPARSFRTTPGQHNTIFGTQIEDLRLGVK